MAKRQATIEREVAEFNDRCPVGTKGTLRKDNGTAVETSVKWAAQALCGSAVAFFEGVSGAYLIDRFTPAARAVKLVEPASDHADAKGCAEGAVP